MIEQFDVEADEKEKKSDYEATDAVFSPGKKPWGH